MDEILNIEYHTKQLVLRSLNESHNFEKAARRLGVCRRTLRRYKRDYNIHKDKDNVYYMVERIRK